ncbi:MAG: uroporphyrinogen-III synthase [Salinivirgaceae bacterium]|nr:uroporphyrinogen-III synthase [Bacteroidales bacterium]
MKIKRILVSQPAPETEKNPYSELAEKHGVAFEFRQFIRVQGVSARDFRKERINFQDYGAIIFTSRVAVDHYFRLCEELRFSVPDSMKYMCISESVAVYLQKYIVYRKRKISFGNGQFEDLIKTIQKNKNENFLVPLSDIHNQEIPNRLKEEKIKFQPAVLYHTVSSNLSDINLDDYDAIIFFSPGGIASLFENFPDFVQNNKILGAFGPTTHAAMREAGLTLNIEAPTPEAPSMIMAIDHYITEVNKKK